jgi:hypothetical protein
MDGWMDTNKYIACLRQVVAFAPKEIIIACLRHVLRMQNPSATCGTSTTAVTCSTPGVRQADSKEIPSR